VEGWTNLLWINKIYTCDVCGGSSGSPSDKTEAFVFKLEVPGFGFG
jgi:V8-like Glu-specific endopeptidase